MKEIQMRQIIRRSLRNRAVLIAALTLMFAPLNSALAQSPMFSHVQPAVPYGAGPYANFYNAGGASVFLPPGVGLQLKPLPPQYRQPLPAPNRTYFNGPYNYPATNGYGSSPYIRPY